MEGWGIRCTIPGVKCANRGDCPRGILLTQSTAGLEAWVPKYPMVPGWLVESGGFLPSKTQEADSPFGKQGRLPKLSPPPFRLLGSSGGPKVSRVPPTHPVFSSCLSHARLHSKHGSKRELCNMDLCSGEGSGDPGESVHNAPRGVALSVRRIWKAATCTRSRRPRWEMRHGDEQDVCMCERARTGPQCSLAVPRGGLNPTPMLRPSRATGGLCCRPFRLSHCCW